MLRRNNRTHIFDFLVGLDIAPLNASGVAHETTDLSKAIIYYILRKRRFSHPMSLRFVLGLSPRQQNELEVLVLGGGNTARGVSAASPRAVNIYFNSIRRGYTHEAAMGRFMLAQIENR